MLEGSFKHKAVRCLGLACQVHLKLCRCLMSRAPITLTQRWFHKLSRRAIPLRGLAGRVQVEAVKQATSPLMGRCVVRGPGLQRLNQDRNKRHTRSPHVAQAQKVNWACCLSSCLGSSSANRLAKVTPVHPGSHTGLGTWRPKGGTAAGGRHTRKPLSRARTELSP